LLAGIQKAALAATLVLWALLFELLLAPCVYGATQTINTLPANNTNFLTDTQGFLANEDAQRYARMFSAYVFSWITPLVSGTLTHTLGAAQAFGPGGFYISQASVQHTYTDTRRTFILLDEQSTGTPSVAGGTGCTFQSRNGRFVFIECAPASSDPVVPSGMQLAALVDTSGAAITFVARRANPYPVRPSQMGFGFSVKEFGATGDGVTDETLQQQAALDAVDATVGGKVLYAPAQALSKHAQCGLRSFLAVALLR
jgi:hypothetical protein